MVPRYGEWDRKYQAKGLSVVGVHTPETDDEHDAGRLARFVKDNDISWPVVIDSDYAVWERYGVDAWPTVLLIDRGGTIRATFVGDDKAAAIEEALAKLL